MTRLRRRNVQAARRGSARGGARRSREARLGARMRLMLGMRTKLCAG